MGLQIELFFQRHNKIEAGLKAFNVAKYVPSSHESNQKCEEDVVPSGDADTEDSEEEQQAGWSKDCSW